MGMDYQTWKALVLFKKERKLTNQAIGDMVDCSGQAVGKWLVNRNAYISPENEKKVKTIVKEFSSLSLTCITNTPELRNLLISRAMEMNMGYAALTQRMGQEISPDELSLLLSEKGADFTPKTLSLLCAVLNLSKEDLPIPENEKEYLFISAMKAKLLMKEVTIFDINKLHKAFEPLSKKARYEKIFISNLPTQGEFYAVRYIKDNPSLFLKKNDLLVFPAEISEALQMCDEELIIFNNGDKNNLIMQVGIYNDDSEELKISEKKSIEASDTGESDHRRVIKVIRDYK